MSIYKTYNTYVCSFVRMQVFEIMRAKMHPVIMFNTKLNADTLTRHTS